jgi:hypothetical protein
LSILGESLLLGTVPVLVETTLGLFREMFSPNGSQRTETTRSLDVTNDTNNNHSGSFDDSNGFDDFLLVHLYDKNRHVRSLLNAKIIIIKLTGTRTFKITDNMGHTSLITHESGQVDGLLGIILGVSLNATTVRSSSLTRTETQMTVTRS